MEGSEEAPTAEKSEVFAEKSEGDVAAKEAGGEAGGEAAEAPKAPAAAAAPPAAWSSVAVKPQPKKTGIVSYRHVYEARFLPFPLLASTLRLLLPLASRRVFGVLFSVFISRPSPRPYAPAHGKCRWMWCRTAPCTQA